MYGKHTLLLGACLALMPGLMQGAATIVIVNNDPAGVGFNDPTVVAPVGGNTGTTLGQQRLIAFQAAADEWGATLSSVPPIRIRAQWTALTCNSTSAVLGSAGATEVFRDLRAPRRPAHGFPRRKRANCTERPPTQLHRRSTPISMSTWARPVVSTDPRSTWDWTPTTEPTSTW